MSRYNACPVCNKDSWCQFGTDGQGGASILMCHRGGSHPEWRPAGRGKERRNRNGESYWIYTSERDAPTFTTRDRPFQTGSTRDRPDRSEIAATCQRNLDLLTADGLSQAVALAADLGLPAWVIERVFVALGVGYIPPRGKKRAAWTSPERDAKGRIVGLGCRHPKCDWTTNNKSMVAGSARGLIYDPKAWRGRAVTQGFVLSAEGFGNWAALTAAGLAAVNRSNNAAGAADLIELWRPLPPDVKLVIVGDNDLKDDGDWPGRWGAYRVAREIRHALKRPVYVAMPPTEGADGKYCKDVRDHLTLTPGPNASWRAWYKAGTDLAGTLLATAQPVTSADPLEVAGELVDSFAERPCPKPYNLQFRYKPESPRAGQRCIVCFRCDSWKCPACAEWKARDFFGEVSEAFASYVDPDSVNRDESTESPAGPWPGDPGNLRRTGPWETVVYYATDAQRDRIGTACSRLGVESARVWTTAGPADLEVTCGRPLGLKQCETPEGALSPNPGGPAQCGRRTLILCVIPPGRRVDMPTGGAAVDPGEWVRLLHTAVSNRPAEGASVDSRLRPVYRSAGLTIPDESPPGQCEVVGRSAYPPKVVKEITDRLKITTTAEVAGKNVQGRAAGWWSNSAVLDWTLSQLLSPPNAGQPDPPGLVATAFKRWEPVLRPLSAEIGDPGPQVRHIIGLYLRSGPPAGLDLAADIREAIPADREHALQVEREKAATREAHEVGEWLRNAVDDDPNLLSQMLRELVTDRPKLSEAECKRRVNRARRTTMPRWRKGDYSKSRKYLNFARSQGHWRK